MTCGSAAQTKAHPNDPLASSAYERGLTDAQNGDLPAARSDFEQAVKLNPWNPEFQNALAQVMLRQGDLDGAIPHLRTVTSLAPDAALPHAELGKALAAKGSLDEAAAELNQAVKLAPQQPEVHRQLARVLSAQGKTDDAITEMKQAVTWRQINRSCTTNWASCWRRNRNSLMQKKSSGRRWHSTRTMSLRCFISA